MSDSSNSCYPEFSSLEELNKFIEQYEKQNYVQLWKRDCRTLNKMKTVCPKKLTNCNLDLHYYSITYACSKGGKQFKSRSKGIRRSTTLKENCPMKIKVQISDDGQRLRVISIDDQHNHEIEKDFFESLPKQRRLDNEQKTEATKLLTLNCNKKLVRSYLEEKTGKPVQLKDLSNLKSDGRCSKSNLEKVVTLLTQDNGFVHVATTEDQDLVGIYYQTPYMKNCFSAYPDLILLDATYKLNNLDMPLYIIMSINGNNEGDVCAVFLVTEESSDVIRHMISVFKNNNPDWVNVKTFLTDKDFGEKSVLYEEFPNAVHQLCMFHVLKRFRSTITTEAMEVTNAERSIILNILQKMTYARSEEEYNTLYEKLRNLNHTKVTEYFNKNWQDIRAEWVECYKKSARTFGVRTTNHLESFNQKIKQVCNKFSNLETFFENFVVLLDTVKQKRKQTAHAMIYKKEVLSMSPLEDAYMQLVTPYAFKLIKEQINKASNCTVVETETTSTTCSCQFHIAIALPCSHIFSVKSNITKEDLFDKDLIPERFLKETYTKTYKCTESTQHFDSTCNSSSVGVVAPRRRILSTQEKYKIGLRKCEKIASIISNFNSHDFEEHVNQLNKLIDYWSQRRETKILVTDNLQLEEMEAHEVEIQEYEIQEMEIQGIEMQEVDMEENETQEVEVQENQAQNVTVQESQAEGEEVDNLQLEEMEAQEVEIQEYEIQEMEIRGIEMQEVDMEENETQEVEVQENQAQNVTAQESQAEGEEVEIQDSEIQKVEERESRSQEVEMQDKKLNNIGVTKIIKLPTIRKRRGRPKGHELTAIGLKRKKKSMNNEQRRKHMLNRST